VVSEVVKVMRMAKDVEDVEENNLIKGRSIIMGVY
jgi:hypothetical protein